jgi:hypothetical protein
MSKFTAYAHRCQLKGLPQGPQALLTFILQRLAWPRYSEVVGVGCPESIPSPSHVSVEPATLCAWTFPFTASV